MKGLHEWMEAQLAEHKTEPNSGLGKAISYLLNHWTKLTLFLREAGRANRQQHLHCRARQCRCNADSRIMPRRSANHSWSRRISDFWWAVYRHNHKLSKKVSNGSDGWKRSGASPDEVAWASARSFNCMSAWR